MYIYIYIYIERERDTHIHTYLGDAEQRAELVERLLVAHLSCRWEELYEYELYYYILLYVLCYYYY